MYSDNKKLTVINFFAGAGVGKSTTAALLFGQMKKKGYKVELLHETAKDYVWEDWNHIFGEQDWMFAQQHRQQRRLISHDIDYAIVDSSILNTLFYIPDWFPKSFIPFAVEVFNTYSNINIFLERNPEIPYVQTGRRETFEEALEKDRLAKQVLADNNISFVCVVNKDGVEFEILEIVNTHHNTKDNK